MLQLAYGHAIASDVELNLPSISDARSADIEIVQLDAAPDLLDVTWLADEPETGWRIGRLTTGFILAFTDSARFTISTDGRTIGWWADGLDDPTLVHLILDHVIPTALSRLGLVVLHAAVVARPRSDQGMQRGAIAIAGQSGWGKSTVGSALAALGFAHVADDCAAITLPSSGQAKAARPTVAPAYPGARLHPHSVEIAQLPQAIEVGTVATNSAKRRYEIVDGGSWRGREAQPVDMIFVLDPPPGDPEGRSHRLAPAEALFVLVGHSFHLGEGDERRSTFDRLATVAEAVDIVQLHYERTEKGLVHVLEEIQRWWSSSSPTAPSNAVGGG